MPLTISLIILREQFTSKGWFSLDISRELETHWRRKNCSEIWLDWQAALVSCNYGIWGVSDIAKKIVKKRTKVEDTENVQLGLLECLWCESCWGLCQVDSTWFLQPLLHWIPVLGDVLQDFLHIDKHFFILSSYLSLLNWKQIADTSVWRTVGYMLWTIK